ncbi:uncharacterized protein LOC117592396 [Drosophila guanche]|uniref:Uncharacterized protein n=1 Tax=Drosophila guanche TaxID=7266 RepID=A0A3B0JRB5_DROGU|nr:uncharacterized protein LOC117592396 [Drosophila guanche]SPP75886.1 Hypothetical predicted protein [Drosophila guanche]
MSHCSVPLSFAGVWMVILMIQSSMGERNWEYEPVSITAFSSDESLLKIGARIDRLNRGEFAFSMTIDWNYDADDNTMVEADAYRSITGDENDYKILPWSIPRQPFYEYLNGFYKDAFIKNVGHCSNFVQFEGSYESPWPRNVYKLDKCVANGEGLPEIAPEGFYKIVYTTSGQVEWGFTLIAKVTAKVL